MHKINWLVLASVCLTAPACFAQAQTAASPQKPCTTRTSPLSPGDIAFSHNDSQKAVELYRKEMAATGAEGERAHAALVRALIYSGQLAEADTEAKAWLAANPTSSWAGVATADVQWRKGEIPETGKTLQTVSHQDPCNAQAHFEIARYFRFNDLMAAANGEINQAHTLDPLDDDISTMWLRLQPRTTRLADLTKYLEQNTSIPAEERKSLEAEKARLSQPSSNSCHIVSSTQNTSIPMRALRDGPYASVEWGLNVSFEGNQRRMEIDTGASGLLLTKAAATALHLTPDEHYAIGGVGDMGGVGTTISKVHSIKIGTLEFQDCDVQVMDNDQIKMEDQGGITRFVNRLGSLDGLIGGDVFKDFLLTLDFPGHTLKLDPLPAIPGAGAHGPELATVNADKSDSSPAPMNRYVDPSMKDWAKVYHVQTDLIVPVHLNNGPSKLFLVDTGAELDSISPEAAREVGHLSSSSAVEIYGVSGKVKNTYTTGALDLTFAGLRKQLLGLNAFDTSALTRHAGVEISGFLGATTLQQLTLRIDYRDMLVDFSYDPKRVVHCVEGIDLPGCF